MKSAGSVATSRPETWQPPLNRRLRDFSIISPEEQQAIADELRHYL
jgi:hypothetical protein